MPRLTLRTLLAYIDDTLEPAQARSLGAKVAESPPARDLIDRIKRVTRRRGLQSPVPTGDEDDVSDPNTVAEYLSDTLDPEQVKQFEETCLKSDVHLAEVAAVHQILTLVLTEPVRVPPRAHQRMYALVPRPASVPGRRPRVEARPLAGAVEAPGRAEADDPDAPLLLGMRRYSSASPASRMALAAAVLLAAVLLAGAVLMSVRRQEANETPASAPGSSFAAVTPTPGQPHPALPGPPPLTPPDAPLPKDKVPDTPTKMPDTPPMTDFADKVAPPSAERAPVGTVETPNALVCTRLADGPDWVRVDAAQPVTSQDELLCLPGFKAEVGLETKVKIHLWGNIPEQLGAITAGGRVPLETRLRIHQPAAGFDADLTLLAGRIFLSTKRPEGATVRVRFAGEVWDVRLKDPKADVMVEVVTAFVPGTPYAREGGERPRVSARLAVTSGAAELDAPRRFKKTEVPAPSVITWDSGTGQISPPKPIDPKEGFYYAKYAAEAPHAEALNKGRAEFVTRLSDPKGIRGMIDVQLARRLDKQFDVAPPTPVQQAVFLLAVHAQAVIATAGPESADGLKNLIDILSEVKSWYVRRGVADALSAWVAREPGHTARLCALMVEKRIPEDEADTLLQLLRGYVSVEKPNPADLDRLVGLLSHKSLAVRELAQWNLLNLVDPRGPAVDMGLVDPANPQYVTEYVGAWKSRAEEAKKRPAAPKDEKKEPEPKDKKKEAEPKEPKDKQ
jgi:hypothetical protein